MQAEHVVVILAPGFEEIEAVTIVDVLRRAGLRVTVAGTAGSGPVTGSHGLTIEVDAALDEVEPAEADMVVLPGGMPGSENLATDRKVRDFVVAAADGGRQVAALCAAPIALHAAGLLEGRKVTCYPTFRNRLTGNVVYTGARVQRDGRLTTGIGPGAALEFSLDLVNQLCGQEAAASLAEGMIVAGGRNE